MKVTSLFYALVFVAILAACNNQKASDDKKASAEGDSGCVKKDSACCKKANTADYSKIIAAKIYVKSDKINDFTKVFKIMIDSTVKEPGCTGYQLFQDPYEKTAFLVFETYKNQAAVDAHFAASYFLSFGDKVAPFTSKASELVIYDVAKEVKK